MLQPADPVPSLPGVGERKLQSAGCRMVAVLAALCIPATIGYLLLEMPGPSGWPLLAVMPAVVALAALGAARLPDAPRGVEMAALFLLAFLIRAVYAATVDAVPFNDFALYYAAAADLARGNVERIASSLYVDEFPFLQGFVVYQSIWIRLLGPGLFGLRAVNSACCAGICVLLYAIGGRVDRRVGRLAGLLYAVYPSNVVFASVLTGQHAATLLYFAALLLLTRAARGRVRMALRSLAAGLLVGVGQLLRPIAPAVLLGIGAYWVVRCLRRMQWTKAVIQKRLCALLLLVPLLCGYLLATGAFDLYAWQKGYRPEPFLQADLRFKFILGLRHDVLTPDDALRTTVAAADDEMKNTMLQEQLAHYLRRPLDFVFRQCAYIVTQWGVPDASFFWLYQAQIDASTEDGAAYARLRDAESAYTWLEAGFHMTVMAAACAGCCRLRKKGMPDAVWLLLLVLLAYAGVHMLIEYQQRYRYFGMPIFLLLAAVGCPGRTARWAQLSPKRA